MKNDYIWVSCQGEYYTFIKNIFNKNITIYNIIYKKPNIYLKITKNNYNLLKKSMPLYRFKIVKKTGITYLKEIIKKYLFFIIPLVSGLVFLLISSSLIVDVRVIHSSKEIRDLITKALEEENIKRLTFKKSYTKLENIKERIIKKYPLDIEWMEIETHGMTYIVRVEQRVINTPTKEKESCNIVAKKSGVIRDIVNYKGENVVTRGDYVSKGDILIKGDILFNNEIKNTVCASGIVKAEVWYTVNVSLPLNYYKEKYTGKKRINFLYDKGLGKTKIFKDRLKNYKYHDKEIFSLLGVKFYKRKLVEIKKIPLRYSEKEAINEATLLALQKINIQKFDKDKIITQKVLKKILNDSTINLEIFFAVEEQIGITKEY